MTIGAIKRGHDPAVHTGTAAASNGTFVYDYPIPTDTVVRLEARIMLSHSGSGHVDRGGSLKAECVAKNNNGTVSFPTLLSGGANPCNSDSTTYKAATVQAIDNDGVDTLVMTVSTTNVRITYTNKGDLVTFDCALFIDFWQTTSF